MNILILTNNDIGVYLFRKELIATLLQDHEVTISCPGDEYIELLEKMGCRFIDTPIDRRGINPIRDARLFF